MRRRSMARMACGNMMPGGRNTCRPCRTHCTAGWSWTRRGRGCTAQTSPQSAPQSAKHREHSSTFTSHTWSAMPMPLSATRPRCESAMLMLYPAYLASVRMSAAHVMEWKGRCRRDRGGSRRGVRRDLAVPCRWPASHPPAPVASESSTGELTISICFIPIDISRHASSRLGRLASRLRGAADRHGTTQQQSHTITINGARAADNRARTGPPPSTASVSFWGSCIALENRKFLLTRHAGCARRARSVRGRDAPWMMIEYFFDGMRRCGAFFRLSVPEARLDHKSRTSNIAQAVHPEHAAERGRR